MYILRILRGLISHFCCESFQCYPTFPTLAEKICYQNSGNKPLLEKLNKLFNFLHKGKKRLFNFFHKINSPERKFSLDQYFHAVICPIHFDRGQF